MKNVYEVHYMYMYSGTSLNQLYARLNGRQLTSNAETYEHMWQSRVEIESYSVAHFDHDRCL